MDGAEGICKPAAEPFRHPGPFFRQETGAFFISDRIMNVPGGMGDIKVAADYQPGR